MVSQQKKLSSIIAQELSKLCISAELSLGWCFCWSLFASRFGCFLFCARFFAFSTLFALFNFRLFGNSFLCNWLFSLSSNRFFYSRLLLILPRIRVKLLNSQLAFGSLVVLMVLRKEALSLAGMMTISG